MAFKLPQQTKRKRNSSRSPPSKRKRQHNSDWECPICFEGPEAGKLEVSKCGHVFHEKCIDHLVKMKRHVCPLCRKRLFTKRTTSSSDDDNDDSGQSKKVWNPFPGYKNNMFYSVN